MQGAPCPGAFVGKRQPLPDDLKHFDEAAAAADCLADTPSLDEIRQKIERAKVKIEELRAFARQRR